MHFVRAALHLDVYGGAAREAKVGFIATGFDTDRLDRFESRHVPGYMRKPAIPTCRTVYANRCGLRGGPVGVELERARRVGGDGMRVLRRADARNGDQQILIITAH